jgi:hypothetical protein
VRYLSEYSKQRIVYPDFSRPIGGRFAARGKFPFPFGIAFFAD